jgi:hypothetical protein
VRHLRMLSWFLAVTACQGALDVQSDPAASAEAGLHRRHVTLTSPADGATLASPATVSAHVDSATCDGGLNHIQVLVNGAVAYADTAGACAISVPVALPSGSAVITVQAIAWDGSLMSKASVAVTVPCVPASCGAGCGTLSDGCGGTLDCGACSAPALTLASPADGAHVSAPVMVDASVAESICDGGLNHLQILVNGSVAYADTTGSCHISVMQTLPAGTDTVTVQAVAWDGALMAEATVHVTASCGSNCGTTAAWPPPLPSGGVDYYVSTTGSDSASGSTTSPWKTIAHAASAISGGSQPVTVHVAPGTYTLNSSSCIVAGASGTGAAPITFLSDQRGAAKIDGNGACNTIWSQNGAYTNVWGFDFTGVQYAPTSCSGTGGSAVFYAESPGGHVDFGYNVVHDLPWGFGAAVIMEPWGNGGYTGAPTNVHDSVFHDIGNVNAQTKCGTEDNYAMYIASGPDSHVFNNLIYNVHTIGIHCWHWADNVFIYNNTLANIGDVGILTGTGDSGAVAGARFFVSNNIVVNSSYGISIEADSPGYISALSVYSANLLHGNNVDYYDANGIHPNISGTVQADPQFVDAAHGNYHLAAMSPAIDVGTSSGAPPSDLDGSRRPSGARVDIGAFEWHP